jgi:DNA-binding LacI/PurR family transcriptional regulator
MVNRRPLRFARLMSRTRLVSLKEVAELAGVSTMTASRALAGKPHVSAASQAAVDRAARKLGYRSNPLVQQVMSGLRHGRSRALKGTIAFLNASRCETDWHTLPYLRPFWEGARDRALASGFAFDEIWINRPRWSARRTHAVLQARGIRGLLVVPGSDRRQFQFPLDDYALASFGGLAFDLPVHQVLPDHFFHHATCFRELRALGYRRIGLFAPEYEVQTTGEESVGGFLAAQRHSPAAEHVPVGGGVRNWADAETAFKTWMLAHRPDAVIAAYNQVERWLRELGLPAPDVTGLVHPGLAEDVNGWSGIDPDRHRQGAQAVDLLTAQILRDERGPPHPPKRLSIRGRWVAGHTTRRRSS